MFRADCFGRRTNKDWHVVRLELAEICSLAAYSIEEGNLALSVEQLFLLLETSEGDVCIGFARHGIVLFSPMMLMHLLRVLEVKLELVLGHIAELTVCRTVRQVQLVLHDTEELRVKVAIVILNRRSWLPGKQALEKCPLNVDILH
jgi:hypothetical protein